MTVERSEFFLERTDYLVERSDYFVERSDLELSDHGTKSSDRIKGKREGSLNDIMNARDQESELEGLSCNKTLNLFYLTKKSRAAAENTNETRRYTKLNLSLATRRR